MGHRDEKIKCQRWLDIEDTVVMYKYKYIIIKS